MREIKFRAKCRADGEDKFIIFGAQQFDNGVFAWPMPNEIQHIDEYYTPLMQFTGLKDKNGKEIFEGDIMKTDSSANMSVFYRDDMAQFVCGFDHCATVNIEAGWAVIGNIYEHPNLLQP